MKTKKLANFQICISVPLSKPLLSNLYLSKPLWTLFNRLKKWTFMTIIRLHEKVKLFIE